MILKFKNVTLLRNLSSSALSKMIGPLKVLSLVEGSSCLKKTTKILTIVYYSSYQPKHGKIILKKIERDIYLF